MKKIFYALFVLSVFAISACHKDKKIKPSPGDTTTTTETALQKIQDSVYLYAKEDYLWYNQLPASLTSFNPHRFTDPDEQTALTNEVDALSQYAINPATGKPYEYYRYSPGEAKYSFIDNGAVSSELNGVRGDFGFDVGYQAINDLRIAYVYPGSPADLAGLKRGYRITSINSNSSLSYDGGANVNFIINAIHYSNTISLTALRPDGSTLATNTISTSNYTVNPVLKDSVYDAGNGHILGYIVFNSFTSDANADPALNAVFTKFANAGVTDVAVDLRYNGGGYVSTAEYIDNLLVPAAKSGGLMYNTYYNSNLQADKDPLLSKLYYIPAGSFSVQNNAVNFNKIGSLNASRVFFIMTGNTASASELTVNNLRPQMDVQFVGDTSYGKPVGFFAINIGQYQYYTPEFYTMNSAGQGGYYNGFAPGTANYPGVEDYDDYSKDWGDLSEGLLAHVWNYLKTGTYSVKGPVIQSLQAQRADFSIYKQKAASLRLSPKKFRGMVYNRRLLVPRR
ncbi:MAG TPA: S41 family peptidase [Mucilaginibacter sp.]|nr:S41 family peptidase [Mucilaginibacter sp.]